MIQTDHPILSAWQTMLARRGDAPAILAPDGNVLRTFAGIEKDTRSFLNLFARFVAEPCGAVIALQLGNCPLLPGQLLALWRLGCVPVLLDRAFNGPSRDTALAAAGARLHLCWPDDAHHALDTFNEFHANQLTGKPLPGGTEFLKLTSGTTGAPRAIRFTAAQLAADCAAVCDTMGIRGGDVNYGVIPWSHSYGFSNLVLPLLCRGIPVVASEDRLPRAILDGLARSGATVFPGLPLFFQSLAQLDGAMPSLRLCISAGAPLAAAVAREFRAKHGVKIHSFYGSSECGGIAYDAGGGEVPEGCVGQPMRGVTLDYDGDDPCRITVRSAAVGLGYFPESDPALAGGRFTPGDLVCRTPHGLVLAGRVSDFINVAGRKLNPAEIEAILRACPGVRDAVVFGVPSALRGEEPVACIVGDATLENLRAHCAALPAWQAPRDFWLLDALPVNERGKLSRRALAEMWLTRPSA